MWEGAWESYLLGIQLLLQQARQQVLNYKQTLILMSLFFNLLNLLANEAKKSCFHKEMLNDRNKGLHVL